MPEYYGRCAVRAWQARWSPPAIDHPSHSGSKRAPRRLALAWPLELIFAGEPPNEDPRPIDIGPDRGLLQSRCAGRGLKPLELIHEVGDAPSHLHASILHRAEGSSLRDCVSQRRKSTNEGSSAGFDEWIPQTLRSP